MRKLNKYLASDYLATLSIALLLITFAMSIGAIYKVIDLMSRDLSIRLIGEFLLYSIPYTLAYSIPISALFSTLLLFGRLSSDSEVSAMKSGGMSMWQIASPIILISAILSLFCLYNNCIIYPKTTYQTRALAKGIGNDDPVKLLDEGRFIREIPGYMIYVGQKNQNKVRDLVIYKTDEETGELTANIRAGSGILTTDREQGILKIDLYDVRSEIYDPEHPDDASKTRYIDAMEYPIRVNFNELLEKKSLHKKAKNMDIFELVYKIRNVESAFAQLPDDSRELRRVQLLVEMHQRICLSLAPFTFVLVAIPLGIKSHRKENTIGMVMSLAIMFLYYLFIIISDTLEDKPFLMPWLIPWIPIVAAQIAGLLLLKKAN